MAKILTGLLDSGRTIVYSMIVAALKADSTLSTTIPAAQWTTYLEDDGSVRNVPIDNQGLPAIRLMPFGVPAQPETQVRQDSPLAVAVTITVAGHDVRDILNLWGAFEAAIFTGDGVKTLSNSIRAALSAEGQSRGRMVGSLSTINLMGPAIGPSTDSAGNEFMTANGSIIAMMQVPK